jgi:branched-chain amino acid transport system permease protein
VTVVVGGAGVVTGTGTAAVVLGTIERLVSTWAGPIAGVAAVLIVAIVVIRILPTGISGKWKKIL